MAKVRIGFSTQFELENELVGIGTDNPTNTLQALGNIKSSDAKVIGVTTLTTYQGFVDTKAAISGAAGSKSGTTSDEIIIEGTVLVSSGTTYTSGPENLTVTDSFTLPNVSDDRPSVGTTRFNENLGALEFYTGVEWRAVNSYVDMSNRGRAIYGLGYDGSANTTRVDSITIPTAGNAVEFGTSNLAGDSPGACSNSIRGLFAGSYPYTNAIDYFTLASKCNGIDFGDMTVSRTSLFGCASSTRGLFAGGYVSGAQTNVIDYVEIMTTGNAIDFGDVITGRRSASGLSSPIRGVFGGGHSPTYLDMIEYVTIASKGDAVDFGNLTRQRSTAGACANTTRGLFGGGDLSNANILSVEFITISSTGNGTDFGNLTVARRHIEAVSNQTRGVFAGGQGTTSDADGTSDIIDYISIQSGGNGESFGDLTLARRNFNGCSDSHGGLGGF